MLTSLFLATNSSCMDIAYNKQVAYEINKEHSILIPPQEVIFQIIDYAICDNQTTKELHDKLKNFALVCKNFKNLIYGLETDVTKARLRNYIVDETCKLLRKSLADSYEAMQFPLPLLSPATLDVFKKETNLISCLLKTQEAFINFQFKNFKTYARITALVWAVENKNQEVTQILLSLKGINVNCTNIVRQTPLILAIRNDDLEIVKILLKAPNINIDSKDSFRKDALAYACLSEQTKIVDLLNKKLKDQSQKPITGK